jgi:membrane protein involved in colicin uptake
MATKKQTSDTESTAAPKTTAANGKAGATKKPAAEKAAPPAEPVADADAPKTTAKKAATPKAQKPADDSASNGVAPAKSKAKASTSESVVKIFGEIEASGSTFFIQKGSVPEGQLQLVIDKRQKQLVDRIPGYNGQFVTVLGEYGKAKKTDKHPTFQVRNLASHDEIARRAYDLSHENPAMVTDNWLRAENELLNG